MTRATQRTAVPLLFALAAIVLLLAGHANAQGAKVGGAWDTTWAGGTAVLELVQNGSAVSGTYSGTNEGKVKGTMAGTVLTGNWIGTGDGGGFVLKFSADGRSFTGTWGTGASKTDGGQWTGTRK